MRFLKIFFIFSFCFSSIISFSIQAQECADGEATGFTYPIRDWKESCGYDVPCAHSHHLGIDGVPASGPVIGGAIVAPCSGKVKEAQSHTGYGGMVIVECWTGSECVTAFVAHMYTSSLQVKPGETVIAGETTLGYLADAANNGGWEPHAHFGIRKGSYSSTNYTGCHTGNVWSYAGYPHGCYEEMVGDMYDPNAFIAAHPIDGESWPSETTYSDEHASHQDSSSSPGSNGSSQNTVTPPVTPESQMASPELNSSNLINYVNSINDTLRQSQLQNLYNLTGENYLNLTNEEYQKLLDNPELMDSLQQDVQISTQSYAVILAASAAKHFMRGTPIEIKRGTMLIKSMRWMLENRKDALVLFKGAKKTKETDNDPTLLEKLKKYLKGLQESLSQKQVVASKITNYLNHIKNTIDESIANRLNPENQVPATTVPTQDSYEGGSYDFDMTEDHEVVGGDSNVDTGSCEDPYTCANHPYHDPQVRAMLDAIAYAEGTSSDADGGYGRVVFGEVVEAPNHPELLGEYNVTISDYSGHPNLLVHVSGSLYSTAAGRYQFLHRTWEGLGLPDFSPASQDIGAAMLIERRGALDLILAGNFEAAIEACNTEWASLPGSPYGQPTHDMATLKEIYNQALQNYTQ